MLTRLKSLNSRNCGGRWLSVSAFAVLIALAGCNGDDDGGNQQDAQFDRAAMFTNVGENIIVPSYAQFNDEAEGLFAAVEAFTTAPDETKLAEVRTQLRTAYEAFQYIKPYGFGPGADQTVRTAINTYPVNETQVESNITAGTFNLDQLSNNAAKGLPALDYLFHGLGTDAEHVEAYTTAADADTRKEYVLAVAAEVSDIAETVHRRWAASGGDYLSEFISNDGVDVGSSLGLMVNEMNFDYELLKNAKIGIPLGIKTLGEPKPELVESKYGQYSIALALANLDAINKLLTGTDEQGNNGLGLDDHLDFVDATRNGEALSKAIVDQFATAKAALEAVPEPLAETVVNNPDPVQEAYNELQRGVVLIKTDLPSALGVLITYQDNDGD